MGVSTPHSKTLFIYVHGQEALFAIFPNDSIGAYGALTFWPSLQLSENVQLSF